jgi:hypothetical protein
MMIMMLTTSVKKIQSIRAVGVVGVIVETWTLLEETEQGGFRG